MRVRAIIPAEPLATWEEAKAALRLDDDDEQYYVELLLAAASAWIDGPDGWLGKSIGQQTLEARFDRFDSRSIRLPYGPVNAIASVAYSDAAEVEQTLSTGVYDLGDGSLQLRAASAWPSIAVVSDAVRVQYDTGFDDVPLPCKQAVLLLVGHWFANREAVNVGNIVSNVPLTVEALLSPFRSWA